MNKKKIIVWLKRIVFIGCGLAAILYLEDWGVSGVLLFLLSMIAYRIYKARESIRLALGATESMIWGKPLEKQYWRKGEFKNLKVKIDWNWKENWTKIKNKIFRRNEKWY